MLKFVVFSDLHIKVDDINQRKVLENIIDFFDKEIAEGNQIDLIFVTGDITNSGSWEEFEIALNFFQRLQVILEIPSDNFLIIPGNHDYHREDTGLAFKHVENPNLATYQEIFRSTEFSNHVNSSFKNYRMSFKEFYDSVPIIDIFDSKLTIADMNIQVLAFNSCLANTIGNDKLQPFVDTEELRTLIQKKEDYDLSIFLTHYPPSYFYLDNRHQLEEILVNFCDILITGHEHRPDYGKRGRLEGQEYLNITSGCVYLPDDRNPEQYYYRFSIIDYNLLTNEIAINPWYTNRNMRHCGRDTSLYPEAKDDGIVKFVLPSRIHDIDLESDIDPLTQATLNEDLINFFRKREREILKIKDRSSFINIRNELKEIHTLGLRQFSFSFLKYLLDRNSIQTFDELKESLARFFIFTKIGRFHNQILQFYNEDFFKKKTQYEGIELKISRREKQRDINILKEQLALAENKAIALEKKNISIIESYKGKKIDLLPPLSTETFSPSSVHLDWYDYYGLIKDPFPSNEGLDNIDEVFYEKIIYETEAIRHFQKFVLSEDISDLINKTISFYGAFGSGKTTLFQYLDLLLKLHHNEVLLITIPLVARASTDEIIRRFFIKLRGILSDIHLESIGYAPPILDAEEDCILMLNNLAATKRVLFIIIEDIYKKSGRREYIEEVVGFIETLQTYKRDFSHNAIPTSFFFSCIEEVVERIRGNEATEGGVDLHYKMPLITLEDALTMINKRLKAFAKDPDNFRPISKEYLIKLRRIAIQGGASVKTFRKYIEILLRRFRRLEFTEDSITIHYDEETILTLLKDIETKHKELHQSFLHLKEKSVSNRENFEKFIKILEKMWIDEPIIEGKGDYIEYKIFIIHLFSTNLVRNVQYQEEPGWTLTDGINEYFDKIHHAYGLFPSNIIPSMYFAEKIVAGPEDKTLLALENIIKQGEEYGATFLKLLSESTTAYQTLKKISQSIDLLRDDVFLDSKITLIENSFKNLLIVLVIQCDEDVDCYDSALWFYENSWYEIVEVTVFSKKLKDFINKSSHTNSQKIELLRDYLNVMKEIVSKLRRFNQWDNLYSLKQREIWTTDKRILNDIRRNLESNNLNLAHGRIIKLLKTRMKEFIYNYSQILFGKEKWRRGLPETVNLRIKHIKKQIYSKQAIDEKELLSKLEIDDLFSCVDYLNIERTNNQIHFLKEINLLCNAVRANLSNENPWTFEILILIEKLDGFYSSLFSGTIPTPWNSQRLASIEDILDISNFPVPNLMETENTFPLIFDSNLMPLIHMKQRLHLLEIASWVIINKDSLNIEIDYKHEKILIATKNGMSNLD